MNKHVSAEGLKECPFCGDQPKWIHHSNCFDGQRFMSLGCCQFRRNGLEADLIAAWNRRSAASGANVPEGEEIDGYEIDASTPSVWPFSAPSPIVKEVPEDVRKDAERLDWIDKQIREMTNVVVQPYSRDQCIVFLRMFGCNNKESQPASDVRAAIDLAIAASKGGKTE